MDRRETDRYFMLSRSFRKKCVELSAHFSVNDRRRLASGSLCGFYLLTKMVLLVVAFASIEVQGDGKPGTFELSHVFFCANTRRSCTGIGSG